MTHDSQWELVLTLVLSDTTTATEPPGIASVAARGEFR